MTYDEEKFRRDTAGAAVFDASHAEVSASLLSHGDGPTSPEAMEGRSTISPLHGADGSGGADSAGPTPVKQPNPKGFKGSLTPAGNSSISSSSLASTALLAHQEEDENRDDDDDDIEDGHVTNPLHKPSV